MNMKLEVGIVPVSDIDRAKGFYEKAGFRLDIAGRCRFGVSWRAGGWNMVASGKRRSRRPTDAPGLSDEEKLVTTEMLPNVPGELPSR